MKIIQRYFITDLIGPSIFGISLFTFMMLLSKLRDFIELIINKGVAPEKVIYLLILILPAILAITIPMGFLLGILMTYGRFSEDNEITAMKASGISVMKMLMPVIWVSVALSAFMVYFNDTILPKANYLYALNLYEIISDKAQIMIREKTFIDTFDGINLYCDYLEPKTNIMSNVKINVRDPNRREPIFVFAERGKLTSYKEQMELMLNLYDGTIHFFSTSDESYDEGTYYYGKFNHLRKSIDMNKGIEEARNFSKGPRMLTSAELKERINEENIKIVRNNLLIEFHKKFAIPVACLIFALFGAPLGILIKHGSKPVALAVSIGIIFLYYLILYFGNNLGLKGEISPFLAMWLPNFTMAFFAIFLFKKAISK
ncbi:MAG TPA: YjgP/YjgQ family permease [Firmicutes bacterium]|nr:YjgP/YjgQ family permease [Bacillota bacterium]